MKCIKGKRDTSVTAWSETGHKVTILWLNDFSSFTVGSSKEQLSFDFSGIRPAIKRFKEFLHDKPDIKESLKQMAEQYAEKRSDVEEYCSGILDGNSLEELRKLPEHRFVKWTVNDVQYMYDTLTTLVEYLDQSGEWLTIATTYED